MAETTLQAIAIGKMGVALLYSLCYGLGGMWRKWIRRFLGPLGIFLPALIVLSLLNNSFSFWVLVSPFLFCAAAHLGYSDNDGTGPYKRLIAGAAYAVAALPIAVAKQVWLLFYIHSALCIGFMYFLGTRNPMRNARDEEVLIGFMSIVTPIYMV